VKKNLFRLVNKPTHHQNSWVILF